MEPPYHGLSELQLNASGIDPHLMLCGSTIVSQWRQLAN
jgi:hypothetical protein